MEDKELLLKIRGLLPSLRPALRKTAQYILKNPNNIKLLRIKELAEECGVAEATVTRFVKTIGLSNYQELKIKIAELTTEKAHKEEYVYDDVTKHDSIQSIIDKVISINIKALQDTKKVIDPVELEKAVDAIYRANKIDIYGAGGSYITAENARMRFYRIGKRCIIYNDPNQQAVSASLLTPGDVAIGISNSGRTKSTVLALKRAKENGAKTICITNYEKTPITQWSDIVLFTSTRDSVFFQESMISRVAQMIIIDILYAALAVKNFEASVEMIEKSALALRNAMI